MKTGLSRLGLVLGVLFSVYGMMQPGSTLTLITVLIWFALVCGICWSVGWFLGWALDGFAKDKKTG